MSDLPLSDLRVVDCATLFAGPLISTLMADSSPKSHAWL